MKFADIVIDHQLSNLHDTFTYEVPDELIEHIKPGVIALVPFGITKRRGVVINVHETRPTDVKGIKKISGLSATSYALRAPQVQLAQWIASYYVAPLLKVIRMMFPTKIWKGSFKIPVQKKYSLTFPPEELLERMSDLRGKKQSVVLEAIATGKPVKSTAAVYNALKEKGLISIEEHPLLSSVADEYQPRATPPLNLTAEQNRAVEQITTGPDSVYLLHGITGSGKTEVYLRVIAEMIKQGKRAIVLVPEIALTPQTIQRFVDRFHGKIAVWHSYLSEGEKIQEWLKMFSGEASIVIGSRSALFTPMKDIGVIVLDEEHEWTYKQDQTPRYHARDTAIQYAKLLGAKVILGTATPGIESYYAAQKGDYKLLGLPTRVAELAILPQVTVVDMREELKKQNYSIFSERLQIEMARTLEQKQQIILFINRRGTSSATVCRDCGWVGRCPKCEVALTGHSLSTLHSGLTLRCHYCGFSQATPSRCPDCHSAMLKPLGAGTQKVEAEIHARFPYARLLRADTDVTQSKDAHHSIYFTFAKHEADILIGTQMIAKGWDLPKVSLVGIIMADLGLNLPDFRASEKTFSLLTQVAGRAGRSYRGGQVILQTYVPGNYTIERAKNHDYKGFYEEEIKHRELFKYPPFAHLAKLTYVHENEAVARKAAEELKAALVPVKQSVEIIGPSPAIVPRAYGKYHFNIILKAKNAADIRPLLALVPKVEWRIDVDPIDW